MFWMAEVRQVIPKTCFCFPPHDGLHNPLSGACVLLWKDPSKIFNGPLRPYLGHDIADRPDLKDEVRRVLFDLITDLLAPLVQQLARPARLFIPSLKVIEHSLNGFSIRQMTD